MRKTAIIFLVLIISACSSEKGENENNPEKSNNDSNSKTIVSVKKIEYEKFEHYTEVTGKVEAVQSAFVSPEMNGQIKRIYIKEGDRVKKGQLLVSLNSNIIKNSIDELKTGLQLAIIVFNKQKDLWEKEISSEIQFLEAKSKKESLEKKLKTLNSQLEMSKVYAPFTGIVERIFQKEGELGTPGRQLIQLVNMKKLYVNAEISESYISTIKKGTAIVINFPSYPNSEIKSEIIRTGNIINSQSRTFLIQTIIDNKNEKIKPNSLAVIKINDFSTDSAIVVTSSIIKKDNKGFYIYVVEGSSNKLIAKRTYIKRGIFDAENTIVIEGLRQGQQIIIMGYNLVNDGKEIKIID